MNTLRKICLIISVAAFLLSLTTAGSEFGWGVLKPLSALTFIVFFITNLLAKEFAKFDEDTKPNRPAAERTLSGRPQDSFSPSISCGRDTTSAVTGAV